MEYESIFELFQGFELLEPEPDLDPDPHQGDKLNPDPHPQPFFLLIFSR